MYQDDPMFSASIDGKKFLIHKLVKGSWTKEEDDSIKELVEEHCCKKWSHLLPSICLVELPGNPGRGCQLSQSDQHLGTVGMGYRDLWFDIMSILKKFDRYSFTNTNMQWKFGSDMMANYSSRQNHITSKSMEHLAASQIFIC